LLTLNIILSKFKHFINETKFFIPYDFSFLNLDLDVFYPKFFNSNQVIFFLLF